MENKNYIDISLWKLVLIVIIIAAIVVGIVYIKKNNTDNQQDNTVIEKENEQEAENTSIENYNEENDYLKKAEEEADVIISSTEEKDEDLLFLLKQIGFFNAEQDDQYESNLERSEFNTGIKLDIASNFVYEKKFNKETNTTKQLRFSKDEINTAIKEIFNENTTNIITSEVSLLKYDQLSNSYIYKEAGDEEHSVYLIKATSKTDEDGTIKVTFLYAYPSEEDVIDNKLDNYDCYRSVVNVKENDNYEYSKYQLIDKLPLSSRIIGKVKDFK